MGCISATQKKYEDTMESNYEEWEELENEESHNQTSTADALTTKEINKDMLQSFIKAYDEEGIQGVKKYAAEIKDTWKGITIQVGVIGRSGVGKSTFINAYRGIRYDDEEGAAPVGVTETTMEATPYRDPKNNNIIIYDVPGVGTKTFPRQSYLSNPNVGIDRYDFIILLTSKRFTEDEVWLYREIEKKNKPIFFVKTKVMEDVRNEKTHKRKCANKSDAEIIKDVIKMSKEEMKLSEKVYFIDSHDRGNKHLDFGKLLDDILTRIPKYKQEALLFSFRSCTTQIIEKKVELLKERQWTLGLTSAAAAAIPIPGLSLAVDLSVVRSEGAFYREQLGLDKAPDLENCQAANALIEKWSDISRTMVCNSLSYRVAEGAATLGIPLLGPLISATAGYYGTVQTLQSLLDAMAKDATALHWMAVQSTTNSTDDC